MTVDCGCCGADDSSQMSKHMSSCCGYADRDICLQLSVLIDVLFRCSHVVECACEFLVHVNL